MPMPFVQLRARPPTHGLFGFIDLLKQKLGFHIESTAVRGEMHLAEMERRWMARGTEKTGFDLPYRMIVASGKYDFTIQW